MSSGIVLPLDTNNAALEVVGGKGRSLAAMASAGMSVPDGFYVITSAYRQYVADSNLQAACLLYTSPSPRDRTRSRMPSSA